MAAYRFQIVGANIGSQSLKRSKTFNPNSATPCLIFEIPDSVESLWKSSKLRLFMCHSWHHLAPLNQLFRQEFGRVLTLIYEQTGRIDTV